MGSLWTHIKANSNYALEAQWIMKVDHVPACSLKDSDILGMWRASLMNLSGISCVVHHFRAATLEEAKTACEEVLRDMGWKWGAHEREVQDG